MLQMSGHNLQGVNPSGLSKQQLVTFLQGTCILPIFWNLVGFWDDIAINVLIVLP